MSIDSKEPGEKPRTGGGLQMATAQSTPEQELVKSDVLLPADSDIQPTISVVIPTLNEEEGIATCIESIRGALVSLNCYGEVIVADSSTDRTPVIAQNHGATVIEPTDGGYGNAYKSGFAQARGEYIAMGDGDTTYDFEELPKLLSALEDSDADMAMGSRLEGEIKSGAMPPLHQYVGNPLLTQFLNVFYDTSISDAHSGMRVFTAEAYERMELRSGGMEFASEMVMEAGARDLDIVERPITYHEREGEATLDSFQDGWRHVRFMLLNAPSYLFSVPGTLMGLLGALVMIVAVSDVTVSGASFGIHTAIAGSLLTLVGFQVANMGAFATIASNPIRRPNDPFTNAFIEHVTLEGMSTLGVLIFASGATYATWLVIQWAQTGFTQLPMTSSNVLAFTAIVLGVQIVFNAFFMSAITGIHSD